VTDLASPPVNAAFDEEAAGALIGRLFESAVGSIEILTVLLGHRLGLYAALDAADGPSTAPSLAASTGLDERYVEEWLAQQVTAGLLTISPGESLAVVLDPAARAVLVDDSSPFYGISMALLLAGIADALPQVEQAFRTGGGVSFGEFGDDVRHGQALFNRFAFTNDLVDSWVDVAGVRPLLERPGARVLDLGCGVGWSTIALAQAFPTASFVGVDSDEASVLDARAEAAMAGVADRVSFEVADAAGPWAPASYDLVTVFEALHDMSRPGDVLAAARAALRPGGRVLVMDEGVEDELTPNGSPVERLMAASSVLHCLPVGRSDADEHAVGTMLRPSIMRSLASGAGLESVEVLPIEHDFFRFYLLS